MLDNNTTASELFNKLRSISSHITLGDKEAVTTTEPEEARFFTFNFVSNDLDHGEITINLTDDELKLFYGSKLDKNLGEYKKDWYDFLRSMRYFAKRNMIRFTVKDITKSNFDKRDYKFIASQDPANRVDESKMYGSHRSSYQDVGNCQIIVRHKTPVDEDIKGSRSRYISKIFLKCGGERRLMPFKSIVGARAMARHVDQGGSFDDDVATHITETVNNLMSLKSFITYSRRNKLITEDNQDMVDTAIEVYYNMREELGSLSTISGYRNFTDGFEYIDHSNDLEEDLSHLQDQFTIKSFDPTVMSALPLVNRVFNDKCRQERLDLTDFIDNGCLILSDDPGCDEIAYSVKYDDPDGKVRSALSDIHYRVVDNDLIHNFTRRMKDRDLIDNEDSVLATRLASKYFDDLRLMRQESGEDYRNKVRCPIDDESTTSSLVESKNPELKEFIDFVRNR